MNNTTPNPKTFLQSANEQQQLMKLITMHTDSVKKMNEFLHIAAAIQDFVCDNFQENEEIKSIANHLHLITQQFLDDNAKIVENIEREIKKAFSEIELINNQQPPA